MKLYDSLPDSLRTWCEQQPIIFVASAPLVGRHINCSPKGSTDATFTIFDANHCAYLDSTGSGAETISHIYENGRVTVMFCSFDKEPRIMRFFCKGKVIEYDNPEFTPMLLRMGKEEVPGARAIISLEMYQVQTSCGFGVPLVQGPQAVRSVQTDGVDSETTDIEALTSEKFLVRDTLVNWAIKNDKRDPEFMNKYRMEKNVRSLDGLCGLQVARKAKGEWILVEDFRVWLRRIAVGQWQSSMLGLVLGVFLVLAAQSLANHEIIKF